MAMVDAVFETVGEVLARWAMGSTGAPAASIWKEALGADPEEAELRLLALCGQFLEVAVTAHSPAELHALPDIPVLALPPVPEALRPLVRRVLHASKERRGEVEIVQFLAARGWTTHPGDWMPAAGDEEVPDVYVPWHDWAAGATSIPEAQGETIGIENWTDWWPAGQRAMLSDLRRSDPPAARALLETKFAGETADNRLRLLEVLQAGLAEADACFLEHIVSSDRAPRVKALAASLLARVSRGGAASSEELAELKGFLTVHVKGLLWRTRLIQFEHLKTREQEKRLGLLLESVGIVAGAEALGMTDMDFVTAWPWDAKSNLDYALAKLIAATGTDNLVRRAAETASGRTSAIILWTLSPRLTPAQRQAHVVTSLAAGRCGLAAASSIVRCVARLQNPLAAPNAASFLKSVGRPDAKPADFYAGELRALGLITARPWARRVLDDLIAVGVFEGDPRLDMLRLNEALEDRGEKP